MSKSIVMFPAKGQAMLHLLPTKYCHALLQGSVRIFPDHVASGGLPVPFCKC